MEEPGVRTVDYLLTFCVPNFCFSTCCVQSIQYKAVKVTVQHRFLWKHEHTFLSLHVTHEHSNTIALRRAKYDTDFMEMNLS
jgi:hypothetical protein